MLSLGPHFRLEVGVGVWASSIWKPKRSTTEHQGLPCKPQQTAIKYLMPEPSHLQPESQGGTPGKTRPAATQEGQSAVTKSCPSSLRIPESPSTQVEGTYSKPYSFFLTSKPHPDSTITYVTYIWFLGVGSIWGPRNSNPILKELGF